MLYVLIVFAATMVVPYLLVWLAASVLDFFSKAGARQWEWLGRFWERHSFVFRVLMLFAGAVVLMMLLSARAELIALLTAATLLVVFVMAWLHEFRFLMPLRDDAFPGQNDKLIWAFLLIVLPPVGLWVFRSYRLAHWPESKLVNGKVASDLS